MSLPDPMTQYRQAHSAALSELAQLAGRNRVYIAAKVVLLAVLAVMVLALHAAQQGAWWLLVPALLLLAVFVLHEQTLRKRKRAQRKIDFYEQGIVRLEDRWMGKGVSGLAFAQSEHLYARDLDLFGVGSLFERLCQCRTHAGMAELARWLSHPAPVKEVLARQQAVQDLTPRLALRERIALASEVVEQAGSAPEPFLAWAERRSGLHYFFCYCVVPVLAILWLLALVNVMIVNRYMSTSASVLWLVLLSVVNYSVSRWCERAAHEAADAAELVVSGHELAQLSVLFAEIESERFTAEPLVALQARMLQADASESSVKASVALRQLRRRFEWLESRHNIFLRLFAPFLFLTTLLVLPVEAWRARSGACVSGWLTAAGELEALLSLACFAAESAEVCFPTFELLSGLEQPELEVRGHSFEAVGLKHPLLPADKAVANDVRLGSDQQLILLSGANMAGKSTLLRAIGLNAVLAQAGAPVCATELRLSPMVVAASICVLDSLQGGVSRFYAEIARLKQIEVSATIAPVLFLLDELLSGTNSIDRRAGTEAFVRILLSHGAIGMVTTHDLALTTIVDDLAGQAANYHFDDDFAGGELRFSYQMRPGIVQASNALRLMRSVGLAV